MLGSPSIRLEKKFWKIEHANDLCVHGYFSASRRLILMQFSTICSLIFFPSSKEIYLEICCHLILTECLQTFRKFFYIIWPLCSNSHADFTLYEKWSERYREATNEKDVLRARNDFSRKTSCFKYIYGTSRQHFPKYVFLKSQELIIWGINTTIVGISIYLEMLVIFIPSAFLCLHHKIEEIINSRAVFVIEVVVRTASFSQSY